MIFVIQKYVYCWFVVTQSDLLQKEEKREESLQSQTDYVNSWDNGLFFSHWNWFLKEEPKSSRIWIQTIVSQCEYQNLYSGCLVLFGEIDNYNLIWVNGIEHITSFCYEKDVSLS